MDFELPPLSRLLIAHAPRADRSWHRLVWLLDQRLSAVVRGAHEPTIALIRMAWWEEALVADDRTKGNGEPLVEAWRAAAPPAAMRAAAACLIEGWRVLIEVEEMEPADLVRYAQERGAGLFGLLGASAEEAGTGAGWALWDLAGHVSDEALARAAIDCAGGHRVEESRALPRPARLLLAVARPDITARRIPGGFSPRQYLRLLRAALFA